MAITCSAVLPGQKTASGPPARSARWWSTLANPRSSNGRPARRASAASTPRRPTWTSSSSRRRASLSTRTPLEGEQQVRAAGLKAAEVHRDVEVAELAEAGHDRLVAAVLPQARDLVERDLQPRQAVVVTDAELAEAERAHER